MAYRPNPFSSRSPHIPSFFPGLSSALIVRLLFLPMHYPSYPFLPLPALCARKKRKSPSVGCLLPASPVVAENRQMWCGHTAAPLRGVR